ncbi:MAG: DUF4175 family protein [Bacteroidales bacterium]
MITQIKKRLRKFIIRYHTNQMIRGSIITLAGLLAVFLALITAEYFGYFSPAVRMGLGVMYLVFAAYIIYKNVILALLKIYGVSRPMSDFEAAKYIGKYMPEVSDKLTNLLQLSSLDQQAVSQSNFLEKAIEQKANQLKPFDFPKIINFTVNRKYLKYLMFPLLIILILILSAPGFITEPAVRLANYRKEYERPQPFYIDLTNKSLEVLEGEDITLKTEIRGEARPDKLYFESGHERYRFTERQDDTYELTLQNLKKNKQFIITDGMINSQSYEITVREKPEIIGFEVEMDYPEYTGKQDESTENKGDLIVPRGTKIHWFFQTRNTDQIQLLFDKSDQPEQTLLEDTFEATKTALSDFNYHLISSNEYAASRDTLGFSVTVIPDQYPEIELTLIDDSSSSDRCFFSGLVGDDYGFTRMVFAWKKKEARDFHTQSLDIERDIKKQMFYHSLKTDTLLGPGEALEYYFKVWDNDGIMGPKASRTKTMTLSKPTEEEIATQIEEESRNFQKTADKTASDIEKMNEDFKNMRKKLLEKNKLDWEDKEAIRQMLEQTEELQQRIDELKKNLETKSNEEEKLRKKKEEILEKEKKLKELMEELMDKELLEKIEELRKLLEEEDDPDKLRDHLEDMNQDNQDMEKELDRNLELFKRLEVEKALNDAMEMLEELQETQEEARGANEDEKLDQQKEISEDFEKIKEKLKKARDKDKELEHPMDVEDTEEQEQEVEEQLEKALENFEQGKSKEGSENQEGAQEKMEQLSERLSQMMQEMKQESTAEDMHAIRQLLNNILKLSHDQEELMEAFNNTSPDDPQYVDLIQRQRDLNDGLEKVKDSLFALSKRQFMVESFINKELNKIDQNMKQGMEAMLALNTIMQTRRRDRGEAVKRQQYVMTGLNNIALMLAESLEQMKQKMRNQGNMQSEQSCDNSKPGQSGKPGLQQMQQQLNDMLDQMKQDMESGKEGKEGKSGKEGESGKEGKSMSERFARSAAKQREIRKQLEDMRKEMQKKGNPASKSIGETLKEMEDTEEDLVNKILNAETLNRQEEILTRLLEHEEAIRKQEFEEEREGEETKLQEKSNPGEFLEYKRIKEQETELLRMVPPELSPFYRKKLNEYYINLER